MSVIWILTTGNSDVKLSSNDGYSVLKDKDIKRKALGSCHTKFSPEKVSKDEFTLPARVMGIIYGDAITTHRNYFKFSLLDGFCQELEKKDVKPDHIIIVLTNQEEIFLPNHENHLYNRNDLDSPYWRDTCTLEPIFEHYLKNKYDASIESVFLQPETGQSGLDDWNATLTLVQKKFANLGIDENDKVIVSHQAGTPAISSAVQLTTLIRYGSEVKFLVGSELDSKSTEFIDGSTYFKALQTKKLSDLLERHDYSGMTSIMEDLNFGSDEVKSRLLHLLKLANLWNTVEFEKFSVAMGESASSISQEWWWSAYESAYLAVVRLKQENTVEAMFHSFRAVEGLLSMWFDKFHLDKKEGMKIKLSADYTLPSGKTTKFLNAYGQGLYFALVSFKGVDANTDIDIWNFGNKVFDKRNALFHKLEGLQDKSSVFKAWEISSDSEEEWKQRVLNCLNFISQKEFNSIEEASLMARVHEELVKEIGAIATNKNN